VSAGDEGEVIWREVRLDAMAPPREDKDERVRRGFANAAGMTFGLLNSEMLQVGNGLRDARIRDGAFTTDGQLAA
jgi:hypothetical protein